MAMLLSGFENEAISAWRTHALTLFPAAPNMAQAGVFVRCVATLTVRSAYG